MAEKQCTKCKKPLPLEAFGKNCGTRDGLQCWCRKCMNADKQRAYADNPTKMAKEKRTQREACPEVNKQACRKYHLKATYGLSLDDYTQLLNAQDGKCAICKREPGGHALSVDHNHVTGRIRGLLCKGCNTGLGMLQDSLTVIQAAATYIQQHDSE